jgi:hypothetical protein
LPSGVSLPSRKKPGDYFDISKALDHPRRPLEGTLSAGYKLLTPFLMETGR